jgi:hypothetical protein
MQRLFPLSTAPTAPAEEEDNDKDAESSSSEDGNQDVTNVEIKKKEEGEAGEEQ